MFRLIFNKQIGCRDWSTNKQQTHGVLGLIYQAKFLELASSTNPLPAFDHFTVNCHLKFSRSYQHLLKLPRNYFQLQLKEQLSLCLCILRPHITPNNLNMFAINGTYAMRKIPFLLENFFDFFPILLAWWEF